MSSRPVSSMHLARRKPLAACVATMFALSAPSLVHAAVDWQVTNCKDDGTPGSLRWAAANANGGNGDTINLTTITDFSLCAAGATGVTGQTLAESLIVGSTISLATGGVTINGPGPSNLSVTSVSGNFRVLTSPGDLTVNNLTVKYASPNKSTGVYYGGCILANNNLTLSGVQLSHCYVTNTGSAKGGAVASFFGDVNMTNVVINKTTATSTTSGNALGGAVYAFHNINMTNSKIYAGSSGALGAYVTGGGGSALGGAVHSHLTGYSVYLSGSRISNATATVSSTTGGSANGGAIWSEGGVNLESGSFIQSATANTASTVASRNSLGGAIYSGDTTIVYASLVTGSSTTTSSSSGLSSGGGIFSKGVVDTKYDYITFNDSGRGGGVYSSAGFISQYSYFYNNNASLAGGAVNVTAGDSIVRGTTVAYGSAGVCCSGLDLHASGASTASITQNTIAHNSGSYALYARAYNTKIYNNTIVYNNNSGSRMSGVYVRPGNAGSTLTIASNLMSSNTYGGSATKNDFLVGSGDTVSGDHNLIRNPGTGVPTGTITGKCPLLYPGKILVFLNKQDQYVIRHEVKSPATNTGSNPLGLTADQRGGSTTATSPPRVSGEPGTTALPDIGAYEINESDEVFDNRFEGCN